MSIKELLSRFDEAFQSSFYQYLESFEFIQPMPEPSILRTIGGPFPHEAVPNDGPEFRITTVGEYGGFVDEVYKKVLKTCPFGNRFLVYEYVGQEV